MLLRYKSAQAYKYLLGGEFIAGDNNGILYKGIMVFMVQGLKSSLPVGIKVSITSQWIAFLFDDCVAQLGKKGFKFRSIATDNHNADVSAFGSL